MIYFDNSATTLQKPPQVAEAVCHAINHFGGASRSAHQAAMAANRAIYGAREKVGALLGASPMQVVFTSNASESLNLAILGLFNPGDHVITTALEHNSVLRPLYLMKKKGMELTIIPSDSKGNIRYEDFAACIQSNTKAIVCTHASNLTGNVLDIDRISRIAHNNQLLFIVDASQTAGLLDIDVAKQKIDVLCFTGHKSLYGPQGTGGLCVAGHVHIDPLKVGGSGTDSFSSVHPVSMPEALEAGTPNGHGIAGLSAAIDYIRAEGIAQIRERTCMLARLFYEEVRLIQGVTVYGDFTQKVRAPIVTLNIRDVESAAIAEILDSDYGICVRSGAHCAPLMHTALGTKSQGAVRFSFSHFNTEAEIQIGIDALKELAK